LRRCLKTENDGADVMSDGSSLYFYFRIFRVILQLHNSS